MSGKLVKQCFSVLYSGIY